MSGARAALEGRAAAMRRVFLGLLVANAAVVAAKTFIAVRTGSLSVLGDAIHSSVDALNNLLFIALMRVAAAAPDAEHPYGHGKFEPLGALGITVFLSVSCFELIKTSIVGLLHDTPSPLLTLPEFGLLGLTLIVNVWVTWYENRRARELNSELLSADAGHTRVDVIITSGVLAGSLLSRQGVRHVDPIIAIIVTLLVAHVGWDIVRGSLPSLVDQAARDAGSIRQAAEGVPGVTSAYSIRSRRAAGEVFAELTIGVAGTLSVNQAHAIADKVEDCLKSDLNLDQVIVHIEPC
ncbi:MAG TPA: cation diffusion facilitator family transporter [Gemmatimonadales bacterium]|jgi:cation diffusion facilitator family transporter